MKFYEVTLNTPYCGTESIEYISAETQRDAEERAEEMLQIHAEGYEYLVTGWDGERFDDEEKMEMALENYHADCSFELKEISEEEFNEG